MGDFLITETGDYRIICRNIQTDAILEILQGFLVTDIAPLEFSIEAIEVENVMAEDGYCVYTIRMQQPENLGEDHTLSYKLEPSGVGKVKSKIPDGLDLIIQYEMNCVADEEGNEMQTNNDIVTFTPIVTYKGDDI